MDNILCCSTPFLLHSMEMFSLLNTNDPDTLLLSWVVSKVITSSVFDSVIVLMSGIQFLKKISVFDLYTKVVKVLLQFEL